MSLDHMEVQDTDPKIPTQISVHLFDYQSFPQRLELFTRNSDRLKMRKWTVPCDDDCFLNKFTNCGRLNCAPRQMLLILLASSVLLSELNVRK